MKPELIEHANRIVSDSHRPANDRWNILDAADIVELVWDLASGALELVFGLLG